ncbi:MAG: hypothetical protein ACLS3V_00385 [Streptococcus sp.]
MILDSAGIYVDYTYSEETYDNQNISVDGSITFKLDWTVNGEEYVTLVITGKAIYNKNL